MTNSRRLKVLFILLTLPVGLWAKPAGAQAQRLRKPAPAGSSNVPRLVIQSSGSLVPFAVAYSPDGRYVLSGGGDRTMKLWDAETGKELRTFTGHRGMVNSVAFSPDGRFALSGSNDKTIKLWDVVDGTEIRTFEEGEDEIISIAFSPTGRYVLSASHSGGRNSLGDGPDEGPVDLWDVATGKRLRTLAADNFDARASAVAFSADGKYAAAGGEGKVFLWKIPAGDLVRVFESPGLNEMRSVAFSPTGKLLAAGATQQALAVWDLQSANIVWSNPPQGKDSRFESVVFSADGKSLAAGGKAAENGGTIGVLKLWNALTGSDQRVFVEKSPGINSIAFAPNGRSLILAGDDSTLRSWSISTGKEIGLITGYAANVASVATSADGHYLLSGTGGILSWLARALVGFDEDPFKKTLLQSPLETLTLWDLTTGEVTRTIRAHHVGITSVGISPDNRYAASGGVEGSVKLWDLATGGELATLIPEDADGPNESFHSVTLVMFSPNGAYLLTTIEDGDITLWDLATRKKLREFGGDAAKFAAITFSPDGQQLISESADQLTLFEVSSGKVVRQFASLSDESASTAFSGDGKYLLTGSELDIRIYEVANGREIKRIKQLPDHLKYLRFSPDGRHALVSRENRPSVILDMQTERETQVLEGSNIYVRSENFSADGQFVFSGSEDGTVRIWKVREERPARSAESSSTEALGILTSFRDKTWAVVDSAGRYDVSRSEEVNGLHWVVNNEPIGLSQLKERYYDPGLLAKLTGHNKSALRDVSPFRQVDLYPSVDYQAPKPNSSTLSIKLGDRGGGIGRVSVLVNDKEVANVAHPSGLSPRAGIGHLTVDLVGAHFIPGKPNRIQVRAWNAAGYLVSRTVEREWVPEGIAVKREPELYAIVAGISTYASPGLTLHFAAKDADDMATALKLGAKRLLGVDKVHVELLTTSKNPEAIAPTKKNFIRAFENARKSHYEDILVVYLAGHGLVINDRSGDNYCYLTADAIDRELADPQVRSQRAITSEELISWIKLIPASKQVMILDTCAAEALAEKIAAPRTAPSEQIIALERLADRTGFHVLMGSSADAVSYESSQYGQGLLTYSLLLGMKGGALREDEFVDVSNIFQYAADKVPQLARGIGGIQRPHIAAPRAESFDIGQLQADDKVAIPLAMVHALVLSPRLTNAVKLYDDLQLGLSVGRKLNEQTYSLDTSDGDRVKALFINAPELPGALLPSGSYVIEGDRIEVTVVMVMDNKEVSRFRLNGSTSNLNALTDDLCKKILQEAVRLIPTDRDGQ